MNKTFLTTILLSLLSTTALADPNAAQTPANGLPATGSTTPITAVQTPHPPQTINCQYRIPAETTSIEESLISNDLDVSNTTLQMMPTFEYKYPELDIEAPEYIPDAKPIE